MTKLKEFFNKVSNNNRIFTAEDIGNMFSKEFRANEKAINYQMKNLGIPRQIDLAGNSDVVYVHSYTRADGTQVKAHYRSKSGVSFSEQTSGGAANVEQPNILEGGVTYNDDKLSPRQTIDDYSQALEDAFWGRLNKFPLDIGINSIGKFLGQEDAVGMWNMASNYILGNQNDYLSKNGKLYNGVEALEYEYTPYKNKIKEKIKSQFGKEDVQGVVLHENSSAAIAINNSPELKNFITQNATALKAGKEVAGSLRFTSTKNLHHAFGKVDVLSAKLNKGGVDVIVLDTYDFNKNDSNWKVKMGYAAQKGNLLNPYFTIVKCRYKL